MKVSVYSATRAKAVEELTATRPSRPEIQKEAVNWRVSCFWVCQALAVPEECLPTTGQIWITCGSSEMLYIFFFPQSYLKSNLHLNVRVVGLGIYFQWLTIWRKLHSLSPHLRRNIFFPKGQNYITIHRRIPTQQPAQSTISPPVCNTDSEPLSQVHCAELWPYSFGSGSIIWKKS